MSYGTSTSGTSQRTITAMFDSRSDAEDAVARLERGGIAKECIRFMPGYERDTERGDVSVGGATEGFFDSLRDLFLPDEDRHLYAEGLNRGGYLVTVTTTDAQYEQALDVLDDEGTIDIDERASTWRSKGWSGIAASSAKNETATGSSGRTASDQTATSASRSLQGEEVIPVAEEELHVGKRETSHGRVRVRSYVVERPVQEQVTLREERVEVERRPVEGTFHAGSVGNKNLFQERTIEMKETREEAVVSKQARVTEELVVKKDVDQRTETISDTVRSTEIEVEDERGKRVPGTGKTGPTDRGRF